jgi:hypothetical protein
MGALIIMLIVALIHTGNYGTHHSPAEYAICTFENLSPATEDGENYASMVISVLLMGFGFLSRVVRLHETLSVSIPTAFRKYLSEHALRYLRKTR